MDEPTQTNQSPAGEAGQAVGIQPAGQPGQIVPGLGEAIAAAFSVPLGPAIVLALVRKQIQRRLGEASAGMDNFARPADQPSEDNVVGLPRTFEDAAVAAEQLWALLAHASEASASLNTQLEQATQLVQAQLAGQQQAAPRRTGDQDNNLFASDHPVHADMHKSPAADDRDDPEHGLNRPAATQLRGEKAAAGPSALNQANEAGTGEKKPLAQQETSGPDQQPSVAGTRKPAELAQAADRHPAALSLPLPGELSSAPAATALEQHTQRALEILDRHGGKLNETLERLAAETRHRQQQTIAVVESILAGNATLARRLDQLEAQHGNARNANISG